MSDFERLGVPAPRRTFLDNHHGSTGRQRTGSAHAATHRPSSSHHHHQGQQHHPSSSGGAAATANPPHPPGDTKSVILAEHKTELLDMLQESTTLLKNIYRSKFVFGNTLKHVDPSFGGDNVGQFNLTTPPSFDPAYGGGALRGGPGEEDDDEDEDATLQALRGGGGAGAGAGGGAGDPTLKEKLRTAEELIKKLYRRNTQLETENKYVKAEVARMELLQGLSRTKTHSLNITDGHLPLDHPVYTKKMRRSCRSVPPQRTLMRTAVDGFGLTFPPRPGTRDDAPAPKEDPLPVAQLKRRVMQLTEALVSLQHDNEQLVRERTERHTLREKLMRQYIVDRDAHIAQLHALLQDVSNKVSNPMKLMRAKQPALNINPVVATNNVLREVSQKLSEQINAVTGEIVRKASHGLPPQGAQAADAAGNTTPRSPRLGGGGGASTGAPGSPSSREPQQQQGAAAANHNVVDDAPAPGSGQTEIGARRKELARRLKAIVDTLPVNKRKQLLYLLSELKELYTALSHSNQSLLNAYEDSKQRSNAEIVRLKMQAAVLRDQLRSLGITEDDVTQMVGSGGRGTNNDP